MELAAAMSAVGMTWLYKSIINDSCECLRISITTRGGTCCARSSEATGVPHVMQPDPPHAEL